MKTTFEQAVIAYAQERYAICSDDNIQIHDEAKTSEADDGIWVEAWVYVPKDGVPVECTAAPPPAPCGDATGSAVTPELDWVQFCERFIEARQAAGDDWTEEDIQTSWRNYQRNPAGHFLSK